jgi:NAD-dependent deacetylase
VIKPARVRPVISEELLATLRRANRVVVFTGAGVSAESGVPTFRDAQTGLWSNFDAAELATPDAFDRDPALVWGWYEWRRATVLRAQPNAAHRAIGAMARQVPTLTVVTQNVDDLHERGGSPEVVHLHGQIGRPYCQRCGEVWALSPPAAEAPAAGRRMDPPTCTGCGGRIRPGVVWFGESLPEREWVAARKAASECEAFLCIGTSSLVYPAASLPRIASEAGAAIIQINPNPTEMDGEVTWVLRGAAGKVVPEILKRTWDAK